MDSCPGNHVQVLWYRAVALPQALDGGLDRTDSDTLVRAPRWPSSALITSGNSSVHTGARIPLAHPPRLHITTLKELR